MPVIACPRCQQPLSLDAAVLGQHVQCPACKQVFQTAVAAPVVQAAPAVKKVVATPIAPPPQAVAPPSAAFDPAAAFAGLGQVDDRKADDNDDRPASRRGRQPRKKGGLLVPLLIGGGVLLVTCCVGGGFLANYLVNRANPPLAFTPFTAKDGSCSVLMPGPPTDGPIGPLGPDGGGASYFYHHPLKDVDLILVYTDYPTDPAVAKSVEDFYANEPEVHGGGVPGAALKRKTPVKLGALSGTDHVYEANGKVAAVVRVLDAKGRKQSRKVMLVAKGVNLSEEDRAKFLNSYKQLVPVK